MIRIDVDPNRIVQQTFTRLEREQLPFAMRNATNKVAWEIRQSWRRSAHKVFDRPRPLTVNAILYDKAVKGKRDYAEVYVRDEAHKGTPPAKYLLHQVEGGQRRQKPVERLLQQRGILPAGMYVSPGKGAQLDGHGNVPAREVTRILSQLGAQYDPLKNETVRSRKARHRREERRDIRRSDYFAVTKQQGHLRPGIWQRDRGERRGTQSGVWLVLAFVKAPRYRPIFKIFDIARWQWNKLLPAHFGIELEKAMETARNRAGGRR